MGWCEGVCEGGHLEKERPDFQAGGRAELAVSFCGTQSA